MINGSRWVSLVLSAQSSPSASCDERSSKLFNAETQSTQRWRRESNRMSVIVATDSVNIAHNHAHQKRFPSGLCQTEIHPSALRKEDGCRPEQPNLFFAEYAVHHEEQTAALLRRGTTRQVVCQLLSNVLLRQPRLTEINVSRIEEGDA